MKSPGVTVIDAPDEVACALPAARRLCVSTTCGAALTQRLRPGEAHPTRCAFDSGGLVDDARGVLRVRRRADCIRLRDCDEAWIAAHGNLGARCPDDCRGFVVSGSSVPLSALARGRRPS